MDLSKVGFIQGVGKVTSTSMIPEEALNVLTTLGLFGVTNKDQFDNLTESILSSIYPRNFIPIPTFIVKALHKAIISSNIDAYCILY